jgi:hypothetical protein
MMHIEEPRPKANRVPQTPTQIESTSGINHLSAMAVEVFALPSTSSNGIANPETDPILAISFAICENVTAGHIIFCCEQTILISDGPAQSSKVVIVSSEEELLNQLAIIINKFDPDILIGYDLLRGSFGYLCERAAHLKDVRFLEKICRVKSKHFIVSNHQPMLRCTFPKRLARISWSYKVRSLARFPARVSNAFLYFWFISFLYFEAAFSRSPTSRSHYVERIWQSITVN